MKNIDDKILELVNKDELRMPDELNSKIDNILDGLPDGSNRNKRVSFKAIAIAATITVMSATTVLAVNNLDFFSRKINSGYDSNQENIKNLSVEIGESANDKGITYTVENVSLDENFMYVFYNIKSDKNLKEIGKNKYDSNGDPSEYLKPSADVYIDGSEHVGVQEGKGYFISDNLYSGVLRVSVIETKINEKFELELMIDNVGNVEGDWDVKASVDKKDSSDKTITVTPKLGHNVDLGYGNLSFIVDKLSISPLGNQIVITEGKNGIGTQFILFDDKGNEMTMTNKQCFGADSENEKVTNTFEFVNTNKDVQYIKLIPYRFLDSIERGDDKLISENINLLPVKFNTSSNGNLTIKEFKIDGSKLEVVYDMKGEVMSPILSFLDENGEKLKLGGVRLEQEIDRVTGEHIDTYIYYDKSVDLNSIKKIGIMSGDNYKLLEDQSIKIQIK